MTKILVTYDMFREGFTELESKYEVTFPEGRDFTYEEVLEMIPEYDVLCSMFDFPVNKELIDHAPKLKMVANYAVGYNNIDVAYCLEKGITVANTPDPVTAPTANLALGLMLDVARRITECDRKLRREGLGMKVGVLENLGINVTGKTVCRLPDRPWVLSVWDVSERPLLAGRMPVAWKSSIITVGNCMSKKRQS